MPLQRLRRALEPVIRRLMHFYWRFSRSVTLGARAMVIDGSGRVFLVKHSYVAGWHLPGGGVETGETFLAALTRELAEEGNILMTGPPLLHGVFFNQRASRRDHVALFIVRELRLWQGDQLLLEMQGGISISEDPNFRFSYRPNGAATFRAEAIDTEGHVFRGEWPVQPAG